MPAMLAHASSIIGLRGSCHINLSCQSWPEQSPLALSDYAKIFILEYISYYFSRFDILSLHFLSYPNTQLIAAYNNDLGYSKLACRLHG